MEKLILVTGSSRYDFKDEKTGRSITGTKVNYIDFSAQKVEEDVKGYVVSTETIEYHRFHEVENGCGFYRVNIGFDLTGKKPKVIFEKLTFVVSVDLGDLVNKLPKSA